MIRVDHTSVQGDVFTQQGSMVTGYAAVGGECPEHAECYVEENEPILLRHQGVATDDQGRRYVDLSAAEWGCQRNA